MVKIAARLITTVATVIPERAGLRRRLSDARRGSTASIPGKRSWDCQNQPTANRINAGQNAARARRKINMPMTPTLNRLTASPTAGATDKKKAGEVPIQTRQGGWPEERVGRPAGRRAACLAFSNGLTRIACQAGKRA